MLTPHALVVTDVVDSTHLASQIGDAANAALWDAHDAVARGLLAAFRGTEIERTDGMLALFDDPGDAVAFALGYHHALAGLVPPLVARVGVHVGDLAVRPNPADQVALGAKAIEVDGMALAVAARIQSIALGGQTLMSAAAAGRLAPGPHRRLSHGWWRLKGVADPIELFEIGDAGAPFAPPPDAAKAWRVVRTGDLWLPVREVPRALPGERDAFVGRRDDLVDLADRFERGARLVTLHGVGGTGKTRLATRYAWGWLGDWTGGAWFCDLAEARDEAGIGVAVAGALGIRLTEDPIGALGHAIAARGRCLLVMDNFEQVAAHARSTVGRWLDRAPEARFLVTSREVLELPGEAVVALPPLDHADAVALFVTRAAFHKAGYAPTAEDLGEIDALVSLLDDLPLAIELAAARVRMLRPAAIRARLGDRFRLLGSAGRSDRQATLRRTLDWSWDLLCPDDQAALAQLSAFEGGFALDDAEAVLELPGGTFAFDAVRSLVDKSLVRPLAGERFDLLVTVHLYATEKLVGPSREATWRRHAARFAGLGDDRGEAALHGPDGIARSARLVQERENLRAACTRSLASEAWDDAVFTLRGCLFSARVSGTRWVAELAAELARRTGLAEAQRRLAVRCLHRALLADGRAAEALPLAREEVALARASGSSEQLLIALDDLARTALEAGDYADALRVAEEGLGHPCGASRRARLLETLARVSFHLAGRQVEARAHAEEALALFLAAGDHPGELAARRVLVNWFRAMGEPALARVHLDAARALATRAADTRAEAYATVQLAHQHQMSGGPDALPLARRGLELSRLSGYRRIEPYAGAILGLVLEDAGLSAEALEVLQAAADVARATGNTQNLAEVRGLLGVTLASLGRRAEAEAAWTEGAAILADHDEPDELGILYAGRAAALARLGERAAATAALAEAERCAERCWTYPASELGLALARARTSLR